MTEKQVKQIVNAYQTRWGGLLRDVEGKRKLTDRGETFFKDLGKLEGNAHSVALAVFEEERRKRTGHYPDPSEFIGMVEKKLSGKRDVPEWFRKLPDAAVVKIEKGEVYGLVHQGDGLFYVRIRGPYATSGWYWAVQVPGSLQAEQVVPLHEEDAKAVIETWFEDLNTAMPMDLLWDKYQAWKERKR